MKIIRLSEAKFWEQYLPLCKPIKGLSDSEEQKFSAAIDILDEKLKKALSDYDDEEDYQTSYDWNPCWHHSCGIYGSAAFRPEFLQKIVDVLATEEHPWCFHIACEPNFDGLEDGQIFIYSGEVFADASDSLDYSKLETTSEQGGDGDAEEAL